MYEATVIKYSTVKGQDIYELNTFPSNTNHSREGEGLPLKNKQLKIHTTLLEMDFVLFCATQIVVKAVEVSYKILLPPIINCEFTHVRNHVILPQNYKRRVSWRVHLP